MTHPTRTDSPRQLRRRYRLAAQIRRVPDLEQQAQHYRMERQALAAAELARMVASYHCGMEA
jgi:hypothetical protein